MSACAAFASEPLVPEAFSSDTIAPGASSLSLPVKVNLLLYAHKFNFWLAVLQFT